MAIELQQPVNRYTVERAYRRAKEWQREGSSKRSLASQALRALSARDPKLLLVLEKSADVVGNQADEQYGRTRRDPGATRAEQAEMTEASLWREAYRVAADLVKPNEPLPQDAHAYAWLYAAAADLAGILM